MRERSARMFPKLGMGELIVILVIVVVLFGATKLPALGAGLGQAIRSLKKGISGDDDAPSAADDRRSDT
jgi:sec-independent protein translocase protein TatA